MSDDKKQPIFKDRIGSVEAAIWENQTDKGTFRSVTLTRNYSDNGTWKKQDVSLTRNELVQLIELGGIASKALATFAQRDQKNKDGDAR